MQLFCYLKYPFNRGLKHNIGLAKKLIGFLPYDGSSSAQLSLTSFETVLLDCIVTVVISVCFLKKQIQIGEFLCSCFNIEHERK